MGTHWDQTKTIKKLCYLFNKFSEKEWPVKSNSA
jgi:hypothetical protein